MKKHEKSHKEHEEKEMMMMKKKKKHHAMKHSKEDLAKVHKHMKMHGG